jgi:hypothetical protein
MTEALGETGLGRTAAPVQDSPQPRFESCPEDPDCRFCRPATPEDAGRVAGWAFLDAVYCISLQSRDDRAREAAAELHRVGLCRRVVFYRPVKELGSPKRNIWTSHQMVARHALERGARTALVLEDDVVFAPDLGSDTIREIRDAMGTLPSDWMIFYLGHWPVGAYFKSRRTLRSVSLCTHAYVASERLLQWLSTHPYRSRKREEVTVDFFFGGYGIDSAFSALGGTYAFFPMVAIQSDSPNDHQKSEHETGKITFSKLKEALRVYLLVRHMKTAERVAVVLSPFAYLAHLVRSIRRRRAPSR